MLFIMCTTKP